MLGRKGIEIVGLGGPFSGAGVRPFYLFNRNTLQTLKHGCRWFCSHLQHQEASILALASWAPAACLHLDALLPC